MLYLWLRALHVIAVIAWMAGLFYLPRLFVYHTQVLPDSAPDRLFKIMERRLFNIIMNPAMVASWVLGIALFVVMPSLLRDPSMHLKLLLVLALSAFHVFLGYSVRTFARNTNKYSEGFWRVTNEVPTLLMIGIVILVIVKPLM